MKVLKRPVQKRALSRKTRIQAKRFTGEPIRSARVLIPRAAKPPPVKKKSR